MKKAKKEKKFKKGRKKELLECKNREVYETSGKIFTVKLVKKINGLLTSGYGKKLWGYITRRIHQKCLHDCQTRQGAIFRSIQRAEYCIVTKIAHQNKYKRSTKLRSSHLKTPQKEVSLLSYMTTIDHETNKLPHCQHNQ